MSSEDHKALIRYLIEEALNKGNLDAADGRFADDYTVNIAGGSSFRQGVGAFKQVIGMWRAAFSDWHMTIEDLIAQGDKVANRFTTRGTHDGLLMGIPPTNRTMTVHGMEIHRVAEGRVAETWVADDVPGILMQLGVLAESPVPRDATGGAGFGAGSAVIPSVTPPSTAQEPQTT